MQPSTGATGVGVPVASRGGANANTRRAVASIFLCVATLLMVFVFISPIRHAVDVGPGGAGDGGYTAPYVRGQKPNLDVLRVVANSADKLKAATEALESAAGVARTINNAARPDTIFVSMASYRDPQCAPTLVDMYSKAKHPQLLYVGVVEQHDKNDGDMSCLPKDWACQHERFCPSDNVRFRWIAPKDARGPTYGRYLASLLYKGEKYFFMMDSHNRFVTHWDRVAVRMYQSLPPKSVLSHYPEAWNNPEDDAKAANAPLDNRPTTTHLCRAKMLENEGFIRLDGIVVRRQPAPMPQPWASAGLLFAAGELLTEVPFDPNLDFLFDGEEVTYSARMWTHGWNIYSPSENIMYHYYYRTKAKRYWSLLPPDHALRLDKAKRRVQQILQVWKRGTTELLIPPNQSVDVGVYGLGTERPIADWYKYANIDRVQWTVKFDAHCVR